MKLLTQTNEHNCGQTCLAMITNQSIKHVESVLGVLSQHVEYVIEYGHKQGIIKQKKEIKKKRFCFLPLNCLVVVLFEKERPESQNGHLIVRRNGKFYDPLGKTYYRQPKHHICSFYIRYNTTLISKSFYCKILLIFNYLSICFYNFQTNSFLF